MSIDRAVLTLMSEDHVSLSLDISIQTANQKFTEK